jgi:PTH2 family peptidyl-tRNA hydrolase
MDFVMYLFVNDDLKMGKGKIGAQIGHCVQLLIEDILENTKKEKYQDYLKWKSSGCKKIVLKATQLHLLELQKDDMSRSVHDAGHTQIEAGSLTVVGFFPSNKLEKRFKDFKLL